LLSVSCFNFLANKFTCLGRANILSLRLLALKWRTEAVVPKKIGKGMGTGMWMAGGPAGSRTKRSLWLHFFANCGLLLSFSIQKFTPEVAGPILVIIMAITLMAS